MCEMDEKGKMFTFIWKIKNFSFLAKIAKQILAYQSPTFFVRALCRTDWHLVIQCSSIYSEGLICILYRENLGPDDLEINFELSLLADDGSVIHSKTFLNKPIKKISSHLPPLGGTPYDMFFRKKNGVFLTVTLTVCCRMWKSHDTISESARCCVETLIDTKYKSFEEKIENFSSLKTNSRNVLCSILPDNEFRIFSGCLCVNKNGKLDIEIDNNYGPYTAYKLKVFILDAYGNKVKTCKEESYDSPLCVPLIFTREYLIENKEYYIPNDVLTLHCEGVFFPRPKRNFVKTLTKSMIYEYDCQDSKEVVSNATKTTPSNDEHNSKSVTTLKDDLISLFREGTLSDMKLKAGSETFPVHASILSARSPVFKSMFETDMREKTNRCVDIDDLGADTVRGMLLFMYSDALDNLDFNRAKNLYFAADKYNIFSLKQICSNFLKENLLFSNCCDVLLLADKHQDNELKKAVQDCIAENDEAVFSSDEWKNLMESQSKLTTEVLFAVYMKNRRT